MDEINYNEVLISGIINVITDTNGKYIKFGLMDLCQVFRHIFVDNFYRI